MADQRPIVYQEGDTWVYRASGLGLPLRSLVAARLGYPADPPPPTLRELADIGNELEPIIVRLFERSCGETLHGRQAELEFRHRNTLVRAHVDGLVGTTDVFEAKTTSAAKLAEWQAHRWEVRDRWAWQTSAACAAGNRPAVWMAVMDRDSRMCDFWHSPPVYSVKDVRQRLDTVEHWAGLGELPPANPGEGWDPYGYLHRVAEQDDELTDLLRRYAQLSAADKDKAKLREDILFLMGDRPRVAGGSLVATRSEVSSESFDTKAFREAHPDLYALYVRRSESVRLTVRAV